MYRRRNWLRENSCGPENSILRQGWFLTSNAGRSPLKFPFPFAGHPRLWFQPPRMTKAGPAPKNKQTPASTARDKPRASLDGTTAAGQAPPIEPAAAAPALPVIADDPPPAAAPAQPVIASNLPPAAARAQPAAPEQAQPVAATGAVTPTALLPGPPTPAARFKGRIDYLTQTRKGFQGRVRYMGFKDGKRAWLTAFLRAEECLGPGELPLNPFDEPEKTQVLEFDVDTDAKGPYASMVTGPGMSPVQVIGQPAAPAVLELSDVDDDMLE